MATKITPEWADTGTKIKPADTKIEQGWVAGEQPPAEWENERMNTRDATINTMIDEIDADVADLAQYKTDVADDTNPTNGAALVGFAASAGSPESISQGTMRAAAIEMQGFINARTRKSSFEEIDADWGFTGEPCLMAGQIGLKDLEHSGLRSCIETYSNPNDRQGIVHPWNRQTLGYVGTQHTNPVAIMNPFEPGKFLLVLIEDDGSQFHFGDPTDVSSMTSRNITGLAAGVTEITAAASDGVDLYMLVRRSGGNDTIAKVGWFTGAMVWEQNLASINALRGYPYDRLIAGDVITDSPWDVELYMVSGNLTLQTVGVLQKRDSATGTVTWSTNAAALTTKQPGGGLAHDGENVVITADVADGTVASLAKFSTTSGVYSGAVAMAASGTASSDGAYDLVFDGRKFVWPSINGNHRYYQPVQANWWSEVIANGSELLSGNGFCVVFDGVNLWFPALLDTHYRIQLDRYHAAGARSAKTQFPDVIHNGNVWSPLASPWNMGRGCRVGPHVVFSCAQPGSESSRNAFAVIRNSTTWTR